MMMMEMVVVVLVVVVLMGNRAVGQQQLPTATRVHETDRLA